MSKASQWFSRGSDVDGMLFCCLFRLERRASSLSLIQLRPSRIILLWADRPVGLSGATGSTVAPLSELAGSVICHEKRRQRESEEKTVKQDEDLEVAKSTLTRRAPADGRNGLAARRIATALTALTAPTAPHMRVTRSHGLVEE